MGDHLPNLEAGVVVQIDESLFRHKAKVIPIAGIYLLNKINMKRIILYNITEGEQHLENCGSLEWLTHPKLLLWGIIMEIMLRHVMQLATLLPIIQAHAAPNTIIHSHE